MPNISQSNYFYGDEATQFAYFRIPCQLITHPRFKRISTDSKLLYGMLLDRMSLSVKNEWYDDSGRVYIYYTLNEICDDLCCGRDKAMKLLAELDTRKGVSLIERIRQGQGKPDRIYVMRFTTQELPPKPEKEQEPSMRPQEADFSGVQKSNFPSSSSRDIRRAEVEKSDPNHTNKNQTDMIHTNQSIYPPTPGAEQSEMDRYEAREEVKERIEYEHLRQELPYDDVESLLELIVDVTCSTAATIRMGGEVLPAEAVKRRFEQLDSEHIKYVIDSLRQTTTKINNIRAYLLTALIRTCLGKRNRPHGYRYIHLWLAKRGYHCNPKTVLRVMRKYGLLSEIRRKRFKTMGQELHRYPNWLDREFSAARPNEKWVTDLTQIKTKQGVLHLSVILDLFDRSVEAYQMGAKPTIKLVLDTIRRGNCYDNAMAENFFSILKTECVYRQKLQTFQQAKELIDDFMEYYNCERLQLNSGLTPFEMRRQAI